MEFVNVKPSGTYGKHFLLNWMPILVFKANEIIDMFWSCP
jgi:hypothetical protein